MYLGGGRGRMTYDPYLHHNQNHFHVDQAPKCEMKRQMIFVGVNEQGIPMISRVSKDFKSKTKRWILNEEAD